MSVAALVRSRIEKIEAGKIITYDDFADLKSFQTVALNLSRLNRQGFIHRLSKGRYYKPKRSKYAALMPTDTEILKSILQKNGGYVGGTSALNRIGISTQVPSEIVIAGSRSNRKMRIANLRLKFTKGAKVESESNTQNMSDIIEALKAFKRIAPSEKSRAIQLVSKELKILTQKEIELLVLRSIQCRPYVRALLGAMLEKIDTLNPHIEGLRRSLNPISIYKIGNIAEDLVTAKSWNIR
jgi:hypothetical protein